MLRYKRCGEVHFTELPDGGLALLDARRSVFHGCNAVGGRIWDMLAQPRTREEITAALQQEYAVDPACCEREAGDFFEQLLRQALVEPCER